MKTDRRRAPTPKRLSRRSFLKWGTSGALALTILPRHVLGAAALSPPSEKLNIALVGVGGMGQRHARQLLQYPDVQIIAVCDVAEEVDVTRFWYKSIAGRKVVRAEIEKHYAEKTPNYRCAEYEDFRVMLEKEKAIDAIVCATPDHLHAVVSITAMRLGKHVYCEKPLAHNVWETRLMAEVARQTGVATQMGIQGHSGEGLRVTTQWIQGGVIGAVREVHAWSIEGRWVTQPGRPTETVPPPAGWNWDLWLGPRPYRPYHPSYAPYTWRGWWAFGNGGIGDMACHNLDPAVHALKLADPLTVEASAAPLDDEVASIGGAIYCFHFGSRGNMPAVKVTWYDGGLRPPTPDGIDPKELRQYFGEWPRGILFIGEKGFLAGPGWAGMPRLFPASLAREHRPPPRKTSPETGSQSRDVTYTSDHFGQWLAACKGAPQPGANFQYSAKLTEIALLGNVALRARTRISWDAANMRAVNAPEAERFIKGEYRKGWELA